MTDHALGARVHIADILDELLSSGRVVLLSKDTDELYLGDSGTDIDRRVSAASTLEGCLEGLTDHPRVKVCPRPDCVSRGRPKPLWCFGPDKDSADGHSSVCKACEAKRIGCLTKKKKRRSAP